MATAQKKTIKDIDLKGKRVIARVDFNVPQDKSTGEITDDKRIRAALPTIRYMLDEGAAVILVTHLGRPKTGFDAKFSLAPVARRLGELLDRPIELAADVIGPDADSKVAALKPGEVLLLENVRFHKEETANDPAFARKLASYADVYVNDAFGTAHRAHASTAGLASFLPAVSGLLIQKELEVMGGALADPARPFVAILGGAKVSDKIGVIENLLNKVDTLIIGGGMAYTFLAAKGGSVGKSLLEADKIELAAAIMEKAAAKGVELLLPVDNVATWEFAADAEAQVVASAAIPDDMMGLDIGPETREFFSAAIAKAGTIVWNGPMGVFEFPRFAEGTLAVVKAVAAADAVSIIGGGDSAAAVEQMGYADQVTHISTGGGASLEYLEGKVLPGVDCLMNADNRRHFVAGNWKMNLGLPAEVTAYIEEFKPLVADADADIALAVPFTGLQAALDAAAFSNVRIAAQNCYSVASGAYTGEVSPEMLAKMGVRHVIIGHSERREYFAEDDFVVNKKVKAALEWGLQPIICCGETLSQREAGETEALVTGQIRAAFQDIPASRLSQITIAYEPIWAIGTGVVATDEQAQEVCHLIRGLLTDLYGKDADVVRIQYGGSVKPDNAEGLFAQPDIDGGLVGGASLKPVDFAKICRA